MERARAHPLVSGVAIAILAVFAGAEGWEDSSEFGKVKRDWLAKFLDLPNGIPSPDTFRRVIARLDPTEFAACFGVWIKALLASTVPGARVIPCVSGDPDRRQDSARLLRHGVGTAPAPPRPRVGRRS